MDPFVMPAIMAALAGIGGGMSAFGKKRPSKTIKMPRFTSAQQSMLNQISQQAMQGLQNPYEGFQPLAEQARRQFTSETLPSLTERFTALNPSAQRSSDFQGVMQGAGSDFEKDLLAMQSQYGMQNRNLLQSLLNLGLQPQYENIYQPEGAGAMQQLGSMLTGVGLAGLGKIAGGYASRPQQNGFMPAGQTQQTAEVAAGVPASTQQALSWYNPFSSSPTLNPTYSPFNLMNIGR